MLDLEILVFGQDFLTKDTVVCLLFIMLKFNIHLSRNRKQARWTRFHSLT